MMLFTIFFLLLQSFSPVFFDVSLLFADNHT